MAALSVNRLVLQHLGAAEAASSAAGEDLLLCLAGSWKRGDPACVKVFARAEQQLVSTVVLAELLSGFPTPTP